MSSSNMQYSKETKYYLSQMKGQIDLDNLDKNMSERSLILKSPVFDSARYQQYLDNRFFKQKVESVKGIFGKCRRKTCTNDEVVYYEKQTRSGDEAMTYIITCTACGQVWRNG